MLLSPAVFDADRSNETARGLANVERVRGVWSTTTAAPAAPGVRRPVPAAPHGRNEHLFDRSRQRTVPVFIPTRGAMPVTVHAEIMRMIEQTLNHAGYFSAKQIERASRGGMA